MPLRFAPLTGSDLATRLDDVARLRIEVFRDWPYLYDGDLAYERSYLQGYRDSAGAIVVGAFDGDRLVGAATGSPLADHAEEFSDAFAGSGVETDDVFYCAESVLRVRYRGQGAGHAFFDLREAHARALGARYAAFCAVVRPEDHPDRPAGYQPLDPFWRKRGYDKVPGAVARFTWKDVGKGEEDAKPLQVWLREL
ncbi:GNAT family N-acetyltransferase [Maritimibacter sp. UBA3975]|uniref:GNAT family N-acetyltransferase n=1 Tax=Maritimibacter sp. UBA3975 TaxID=1946833 RepID=UPI000C095E79|nr:GNAT family N-acetyltransferase [Maritimibacter sp. UBA3975]MAM59878.1 GNAT family N-acetyltransferase [Maritimibacter sp.]|tara:strand:- start:15992 stop:16579 length:588 start_codon:yes stop_codon:yes gene_type:complete